MNKKKIKNLKRKKIDEIRQLEEIEYGLKELIHGLVLGVIIGFALAWFLLK
jgi:hypothetical protein